MISGRLSDKSSQVTSTHVCLHNDASFPVLAAHLISALTKGYVSDNAKRDKLGVPIVMVKRLNARRQRAWSPLNRNCEVFQLSQVATNAFGQTYDNIKTSVTFKHLPDGFASQRSANHILDIANTQAVA